MRLICPTAFKGSLSPLEAARRLAGPGDALLPLSDGGDGFLECLEQALGGCWRSTPAADPFGRIRWVPWLELPDGLDADGLNRRLFKHGAAILKGFDCDMARPHDKDPGYRSPYASYFRFSFGPLLPESFESDIAILRRVLGEYRASGGKN